MQCKSLLLAALGLLTAACAPRLYERRAVTLDHDNLDAFEIRYAEFEGCLLQRPVPVRYRVERPQYTMSLDLHFGDHTRAPGIELQVDARERPTLNFPDLSPQPAITLAEGTRLRTRIDAAQVREGAFTAEVLQNGAVLGRERFRVLPQQCKALSLGH